MGTRRIALVLFVAACLSVGIVAGQAPKPAPLPVNTDPVRQADLKRWLTTLASDAMEGRVNGTDSLVRAGDYLAAEAGAIGLEPGGDNGTFFENFQVTGARTVTNRSTLTVEVNGQTRVFRHGEGVRFPPFVGGRRSFTLDQVEFIGYGLDDPALRHDDFAGKDLRGKAVVWLGLRGPKGAMRVATEFLRPAAAAQSGAAAFVGPTPAAQAVAKGEAAGRPPAGGPQTPTIDFTTVRPLDDAAPPPLALNVLQPEAFYSFLLTGSGVTYPDLETKANLGAPLPSFTLKGVKLTFNLDADYAVVRSNATRNVVGILRGSDPALGNTYVVLGAHYDHIATGVSDRLPAGPAPRAAAPAGAAAPATSAAVDHIYNGADDDASGCAALLAIAQALAQGPRPRRTVVFVWFAAEERGLLGSQYHATYGPPSDRVAAMLDLDMVGRNADNRPEAENTVYVVGADRISTELHNINEDANASLPGHLTLDYRYNDRSLEGMMYFSSDHYSYALKGIPVILFSTGRHPDYHRVTDSVDRIEFPKLARIARLVCETTKRMANLDHAPVRDRRGPRAGKGHVGRIAK
jgi:hypothetical protein